MVQSRQWSFVGTDGGRRAVRSWQDGAPTHVLLLAHGYGEHGGRYDHVAAALVANGAVVHAVDHVGHGRSEGERALIGDYEQVVSDLHTVAESAAAENPGRPTVLVGHSMGGLIASRYAQRYAAELTALVLSGPLIGSFAAANAMLAMPEIPDVPLDISTLSRDPAVGADYVADPLVWHGPFKRPTLEAILRAIDTVQAGPALGTLPLLWVHGAADPLVPVEGSRPGIEHLRGEVFEQHLYDGAKHEIFNETNRDEVLADVCAFINLQLSGRAAPVPG